MGMKEEKKKKKQVKVDGKDLVDWFLAIDAYLS